MKRGTKHGDPLLVARPVELEHHRSATADCGIDGIQPVRTHDDRYRKALGSDLIHTANKGVYSGTILMVHLGSFARLREGVGFVDQQNDPPLGPVVAATGFGHCLADLPERAGDEPCHLADRAAAAGV